MQLFKLAYWKMTVSVVITVAVIKKKNQHMLAFVHVKAH